jgi:hypothetical protein
VMQYIPLAVRVRENLALNRRMKTGKFWRTYG